VNGGIWIGDILRALHATDRADHRRVYQMLGFEAAEILSPEAGSPMDDDTGAGQVDREEPMVLINQEKSPAPLTKARASNQQPPLVADIPLLTPVRAGPAIGHAGGAPAGASLPRVEEERHLSPVLPHQPLLPPATAPAILHRALSRHVAEGAIDITALVETVARCQPITLVPRQPVPTLRYGIEVLVDLGPGMQPFRRDQAEITRQITGVVGREKVTVRYFAYCPLRGAGPGAGWTWQPYSPPSRHTPILLLSDLGIGGPTGDFRRSTLAEWREFGRIAADNGSDVIALVVYPANRWPTWLAGLGSVLTWDRTATARSVPARS
jgi:hypothetical protein